MRLDVLAVALLATVPFAATAPGLADPVQAQDTPPAGHRVYALAMESNRFNAQTWPDTPLLEAYEGERMQFLVHVPVNAEMHTFHLHGHPWRDADTGEFVDAVRLDAGETLRFNQTAGLGEGHAGDWFYHCHVGTHFGQGMWGLLRVYPYAVTVTGGLDGLTVHLHDDGRGLDGAAFTATLRENTPDTPTAATSTAGRPVDLSVEDLGGGRYQVTPDVASTATGELVLQAHHESGESIARLDLDGAGGYTLDRDVVPPQHALSQVPGLDPAPLLDG